MLKVGMIGEANDVATKSNSAAAFASGALEVYATPAMIGLMEQAACACVDGSIDVGSSTVGTLVDIKHLSATPIGMKVTARAELVEIDRRRLVFSVSARDEAGPIGEGRHERFIVAVDKFMAKAQNKDPGGSAPPDPAAGDACAFS